MTLPTAIENPRTPVRQEAAPHGAVPQFRKDKNRVEEPGQIYLLGDIPERALALSRQLRQPGKEVVYRHKMPVRVEFALDGLAKSLAEEVKSRMRTSLLLAKIPMAKDAPIRILLSAQVAAGDTAVGTVNILDEAGVKLWSHDLAAQAIPARDHEAMWRRFGDMTLETPWPARLIRTRDGVLALPGS